MKLDVQEGHKFFKVHLICFKWLAVASSFVVDEGLKIITKVFCPIARSLNDDALRLISCHNSLASGSPAGMSGLDCPILVFADRLRQKLGAAKRRVPAGIVQ